MDNAKIIKTAKSLDTIVKIVGMFTKFVGIIGIAVAFIILAQGDKLFADAYQVLDLDIIKIHVGENVVIAKDFVKYYYFVGMLVESAIYLLVSYICTLVREILSPMKEGRPFEANIPDILKKIAGIVFLGGGAMELYEFVGPMLLLKAFPIRDILAASTEHIEYSFSMNFEFVLFAWVILFLSYIFSYGQTLQQESDETL